MATVSASIAGTISVAIIPRISVPSTRVIGIFAVASLVPVADSGAALKIVYLCRWVAAVVLFALTAPRAVTAAGILIDVTLPLLTKLLTPCSQAWLQQKGLDISPIVATGATMAVTLPRRSIVMSLHTTKLGATRTNAVVLMAEAAVMTTITAAV
mmetsp:Transcript_89193/g.247707  ORF Transcript_89193/g.247707 Transcript_89193/m.247707 type:complete len:155 (+) Transcript_89193:1135-1599(+)